MTDYPRPILNATIPELRQQAKALAKTDWQQHKFGKSYQQVMLKGLVIGYTQLSLAEKLKHIQAFVPQIADWAVCDVFCATLKFARQNQPQVWDFLQPYLASDKEFEIRFGVVMLLSYFIDDQHIEAVLAALDKIRHEGYYAKMAVAWAISVCFVKQWDKTLAFFENCQLPAWTYRKSVQKSCESFRLTDEQKSVLRKMRQNR